MKTYADGIGTLYNTLKDNNLDSSVASAARPSDNVSAPVTSAPAPDKALSIPASSVAAPAARSPAPLAAESDKLSAGTSQLKSSLKDGMTQATESYSCSAC